MLTRLNRCNNWQHYTLLQVLPHFVVVDDWVLFDLTCVFAEVEQQPERTIIQGHVRHQLSYVLLERSVLHLSKSEAATLLDALDLQDEAHIAKREPTVRVAGDEQLLPLEPHLLFELPFVHVQEVGLEHGVRQRSVVEDELHVVVELPYRLDLLDTVQVHLIEAHAIFGDLRWMQSSPSRVVPQRESALNLATLLRVEPPKEREEVILHRDLLQGFSNVML
jgi:hypothetical protein